jgi:FtsH-binding integral membrane protein
MTWFDYVRIGGVVIGGLGAFVFVGYYGFTSPWYKSNTGRFLMMSGVGWASLYLSGIINAFVKSQIVTDIIRIILIVLAASIVWQQVFLYHKARKKGRRENK